jgi:hypothetical protein
MSRNKRVSASGPRSRENASDIYDIPFEDRQLLGRGPRVHVVDHRGDVVTEMPLALFRALSTKRDILVASDNSIRLPRVMDSHVVNYLFQHLIEVICEERPGKLQWYSTVYEDLQLCSIADYLEMTIYTQRLVNIYLSAANADQLPEYDDLIAYANVETSLGKKIFRKVVDTLVRYENEGKIDDKKEYASYLQSHKRIRNAVAEAREETTPADLVARNDGGLDAGKNHPPRMTRQEREAKDKKKWATKEQKDKELGARARAKQAKPGKKKYTPAEARYLTKLHGGPFYAG